MADLHHAQGDLETFPCKRNIFECGKLPNVKILAIPSGLHISCPIISKAVALIKFQPHLKVYLE